MHVQIRVDLFAASLYKYMHIFILPTGDPVCQIVHPPAVCLPHPNFQVELITGSRSRSAQDESQQVRGPQTLGAGLEVLVSSLALQEPTPGSLLLHKELQSVSVSPLNHGETELSRHDPSAPTES